MSALRRLVRAVLFGWGEPLRPPVCCTCDVLGCDRSRFWRGMALRAEEDADRYARQLADAGKRPTHVPDGTEAL